MTLNHFNVFPYYIKKLVINYMESIISLLSDIENEANSIIDNAITKKNALYKEYSNEIAKIDKEYSKKLKIELEKIQSKSDSSVQKELENIKKTSDNNIADLENKFKTNHDKYLNTLFNNIIDWRTV